MKAAAVLLIAAALGPAHAQTKAKPFVIDDDGGGNIGTYMDFYWRLNNTGLSVVLDGKCVSACTLVLHLAPDRLCATPRAELGFHRPTSDDSAVKRGDIADFARHVYPPKIADWYLKQKFDKRNDPIFKNAVAMGVRPCDAEMMQAVRDEAAVSRDLQ